MKNKKNENKEGEPWSALLLYCIMMTDSAGEFKLKRKERNTDKKHRQTCENKFFRVYWNNHWPLQLAARIK